MTDNPNGDSLPDINIAAIAKRNGMTVTFFSTLAALTGLWLVLDRQQVMGPLLLMISTVGLSLGFAKLQQPAVSVRLTPQALYYYQARGCWQIHWGDLQRIDIAVIDENYQTRQLPFIGISLRDHAYLLNEISNRLSIGILTEQRPLLQQALRYRTTQAISPSDTSTSSPNPGVPYPTELLFEKNHYIDANGKEYDGIKAMLAHRMKVMRQLLGFDLYIPINTLDRSPEDFVALIRKYKAAALLYDHTHPPSDSSK